MKKFSVWRGLLALVLTCLMGGQSFAAGIPAGAEDSFNRMNSIAVKYQLGTLIKQALGSAAGVALGDGKIFLGDSGGIAQQVTPAGDVTISDTGTTAIGAGKVTAAMIVANAITATQLDKAVFQYTASITATQALLLAANTTPIPLIAAPGLGKLIVVDEVEILHTYSTAAYATCTAPQVLYHASTVIVSAATATVTGTATKNFIVRPNAYDVDNSSATALADMTSLANLGVDFKVLTGDCTSGNVANVLKIRVKYRILTLLT